MVGGVSDPPGIEEWHDRIETLYSHVEHDEPERVERTIEYYDGPHHFVEEWEIAERTRNLLMEDRFVKVTDTYYVRTDEAILIDKYGEGEMMIRQMSDRLNSIFGTDIIELKGGKTPPDIPFGEETDWSDIGECINELDPV